MTDENEDESRRDKFGYTGPAQFVASQCLSCERYGSGAHGNYCRPFPGGIPPEILDNNFDHRKPHPGENEPLRFIPQVGIDPVRLDYLYRALDKIT